MGRMAIAIVLALLPVSLGAQWLNLRTPGIPRTADGQPNLTAPAPRTPDGKPDLSGLWRPEDTLYGLDLIQEVKDEAVFRPEAEAVFLKHVGDLREDDPQSHCLPGGPSQMFGAGGWMYRIVQSPTVVALLYENGHGYRQIFTDGRELPKDPNPTWLGYSIGHWESDTLVVETAGFNDRTWLDRVGHPHSQDLRVTERFRRVDFGHMQFQITFTDPKTLTGPLTRSLTVNFAPDTDSLEHVCNENERDTAHFVGHANTGVKVSPAVLATYAGTYEFRDGPPTMRAFFGANQTLTVINERLYLNALPLVAESETMFDTPTGAAAGFFLNSNGVVTHFILSGAEGDARYDRKP
jgi:hypothetical protein